MRPLPNSGCDRRCGMTLIELLVVVATIGLLAAILFPVCYPCHSPTTARQHNCQSNMKRIGLAMMQYTVDNDDRFPPAQSETILQNGERIATHWVLPNRVSGILSPFMKQESILVCPEIKGTNARLTYMYNDLAATAQINNVGNGARSILVAEGENTVENVGHAWLPQVMPRGAVVNSKGTCDPGRGATVRDTPRRHTDGANYLFVDGHVKWFKPERVFFPDARTNHRSHRLEGYALGPDPAGDMRFGDVEYAATFHMK